MATVRVKSEVWNYFKIDGKRSTCNFCGKQAYKNPSRMPLHLTKCSRCPEALKLRMLAELPKSLSKSAPISSTSSTCILGTSDCEAEQTEVEVVDEDDVENVIYMPNRCSYDAKRSEASSPIKYIEKSEDEFTLFGNSVAHKLRNINNARARVIAQYYINTVLFRAEMTNFNQDISLPIPQDFSLFDSVYQENACKEDKTETTC